MTEANKDCDTVFYSKTLNYNCKVTEKESSSTVKFKDLLHNYSMYIPGQKNTDFSGIDCKDMVVQGICTAEGYLLISAYCSEQKHSSVIYVLNEGTGAFVKTMVLPDSSHVGGLAFDGTYLWVCSTGKTITAYRFSICRDLFLNRNPGLDYVNIESARKSVFSLDVTTSFCTFYDGRFWIGNFTEYHSTEQAYIYGYHFISYQDTLMIDHSPDSTVCMKSMDRVQGIAFLKYNNKVYLTLSRSYRRKKAVDYISELRIFQSDSFSSINVDTDFYKSITLPPMAEDITSASPYTYLVFESAAKKYSADCAYPNNRICRFLTFGLIV